MEIEMEKEKNIIITEIECLKENIKMILKKVGMNIILKVTYILKENRNQVRNGMVKDLMRMVK